MRPTIKQERIRSDRLYLLSKVPGISGFQRWNERELSVVLGSKARHDRPSVVGEYWPLASDRFRLDDGHLPDHQPRANGLEAAAWLRSNPSAQAFKV